MDRAEGVDTGSGDASHQYETRTGEVCVCIVGVW